MAAADRVIENDLKPDWEEYARNWRGEYWLDDGTSGHKVSVNMVRGIVSLMTAALYFADPRVIVGAKKPGLGRAPQLAEALFNYYLEELQIGAQVKKCIKDALLFDAGYLKVGYEIDMGTDLEALTDESGQDLYDGSGSQLLKDPQGNLYVERDGRLIQLMEKDGELVMQEQEQPTLNEFVRREQPFAVRWAPWDVLRDPEARYVDLSDSRWIAFRSCLPLEEVKGNPLYKNTQKLEGGLTLRKDLLDAHRMYDNDELDPDIERVEIFEVWCKEWNKTKRRYDIYQKVVAADHDEFLLYRLSPYLADGFPCKVLAFDEDPEKPYGSSPLRAIDSQIESINISRSQMAAMQDQQIQKWLANGNHIDEQAFQDFSEMPNGGGLILKNIGENTPVENVVKAVPIPQIPPDIRVGYDLARDEIQVIFGVTDYQMGGSGGPKRQATEAGLIQSGFTVRVEEKRQQVGKMIEGVVKYFAMLLHQFGDYSTFVKITGDMGQEEFVPFKIADAVTDELKFSIDVYGSVFQSRDMLLKKAMDRYNLMRADPLVNPAKLIEDVFRADGIQEVAQYLAQQQPMMQPGMGMEQPQLKSIAAGGGAMDTNALRAPAATDPGATGRAISG